MRNAIFLMPVSGAQSPQQPGTTIRPPFATFPEGDHARRPERTWGPANHVAENIRKMRLKHHPTSGSATQSRLHLRTGSSKNRRRIAPSGTNHVDGWIPFGQRSVRILGGVEPRPERLARGQAQHGIQPGIFRCGVCCDCEATQPQRRSTATEETERVTVFTDAQACSHHADADMRSRPGQMYALQARKSLEKIKAR